jgi:hypothetical protein
MWMMNMFEKLNCEVHHSGAINQSADLGKPDLFPKYNRIIASNRFLVDITVKLIESNGWNEV